MEQRSTQRRGSSAKPVPPYRNKRFMAILAAALTFGAFVTVTQVSNAADRRRKPPATQPCPTTTGTAQQPAQPEVTATQQDGREVRQYRDDGTGTGVNRRGGTRPNCTPTTSTGATPTTSSTGGPANEVIARDCSDSRLPEHDGSQTGNRCVTTAHGEVPTPDKAPSLLITAVIVNGQRRQVGVGPIVVNRSQPFQIEISTRNLQRNRFLPAGQNFYYQETSLLNGDQIVQGHAHTACNPLSNTNEAPDREPVPAFFVATEDQRGGEAPDRFTVSVPGLATAGLFLCGSWTGDGSHRVALMPRANQMPSFDTVRIIVR
jgi:hypothetical protein